MANALLTIGGITKKAIALYRNSNAFLRMIDRQYDSSFAKAGAKIGSQLRIRLPNDYIVRTGATANPQNTTENQVTLTVGTQLGVDMSFGSAELALSMDDFSNRVLAPAVNDLAAGVASTIMAGAESINNIVQNISGGNMVSPTSATFLQAGAILDLNSCPRGDRSIICDPMSMSRVVNSLTGLFNPQPTIGKQFVTGLVAQNVLGFDWAYDQTVLIHNTGTFTTGSVNGANQTGSTIAVTATTGTLNVGDIVTLAGVYQVNNLTKLSNGMLQQFVITAAAAAGATSLSIYPPVTPPVSGNAVAYQTVTASPANSAAITAVVAGGASYRKNFAFHPLAVTMATADLELPTGAVVAAARESYDGVSLRMVRDYNSVTDAWLTRLDLLFGWLWVRPNWAVVVADTL